MTSVPPSLSSAWFVRATFVIPKGTVRSTVGPPCSVCHPEWNCPLYGGPPCPVCHPEGNCPLYGRATMPGLSSRRELSALRSGHHAWFVIPKGAVRSTSGHHTWFVIPKGTVRSTAGHHARFVIPKGTVRSTVETAGFAIRRADSSLRDDKRRAWKPCAA